MPGPAPTEARGLLWKRLALIAAGLLLGAVLAEGLLRWLRPDLRFNFPTDPPTDRDILLRRNQTVHGAGGVTITFDANGFRLGSGLPYDRTVLFVGDSFTRGEGVQDNETFARVAEDRLRDRGLRVRSLNIGAQGFGAAHELRVLRAMLASTPVDAVVLQVFPHNDLTDNWEDGGFGLEGERLVAYDPPRRPLSCRIRTHLCFESALRDAFLFRALANVAVPADFFTAPDSDASFDLERALLAETVKTAHQRHIPIIIAIVPIATLVSGQTGPEESADRMRFERILAIAEKLDAPVLDLRTVTRDSKGDFIPGDGHFSVRGNALTGAALAERLAPLLRRPGAP